MINKKKVTIIGSFTIIVAAGAVSASVASAGFFGGGREDVKDALRNKDYDAFVEATKNCPMAEKIDTEKEFHAMTLAHDLRQEGKYKEAREVLERAGIERYEYKGMRGPRADVRDAVENGDWQEFQEVIQGKKLATIINTEEKFDLFVEMHELRKEGRHDEAKEIREELGLKDRK